MKATLTFKLPEENEDFNYATNGWKYSLVLDEIHEKVWKPSWKWGYNNRELNELLDDEKCLRTLNILHEIYLECLKERELPCKKKTRSLMSVAMERMVTLFTVLRSRLSLRRLVTKSSSIPSADQSPSSLME